MSNEIDNSALIKQLFLDFSDEDRFYHIMILRRKKDNPSAAHAKLVKDIYVNNMAYFERKLPFIKELCQFMSARAYINLNRRSYRKAALEQMEMLAKYIKAGQYDASLLAHRKGVAKATMEKPRKWVIDLDGDEVEKQDKILEAIDESAGPKGERMGIIIPTKNGKHMITSPFNVKEFGENCRAKGFEPPDVKKNNPTILYTPGEDE